MVNGFALLMSKVATVFVKVLFNWGYSIDEAGY